MAEGAPPILAVANQKGGVGKTTTAINLAAGLAAEGARTLLVDLDPQGNASTGLGVPARLRRAGTYRALQEPGEAPRLHHATEVERLAIMPASPELAGAEIELVGMEGREFRLRQALSEVRGAFDAVVIDCPPSLGLLTLNGLGAASSVLIPLQCEFFALEGITQLMRTLERVARGLNPALQITGIVLTMVDRRNNLAEQVEADARSFFKDLVLDTVIPRNVRLSEAPSHGKPVAAYDRASAGAQAYGKLTQEVRQRLERMSA